MAATFGRFGLARMPLWLAARLCALCLALTTTAQGQTFTGSRASAFAYAANGLLTREVIEPTTPDLCVQTTYAYGDAYGNRTAVSTSNCSGAAGLALFDPRTTAMEFAAFSVSLPGLGAVSVPAGTFATRAVNALLHDETRTWDPRFGQTLSLTGPNALTTRWTYDDFGRRTLETRADGTRTASLYCLLSDPGLTNSEACPTLLSLVDIPPAPAAPYRFEQSETQDTAGLKMGPLARVYFDRAGRKLRTSTEAFDGALQPAAMRGLVVQDTEYNAFGAVTNLTQPYFLGTAAAEVGMTQTAYDTLGRVIRVAAVDSNSVPASPNTADFGTSRGGVRTVSVTTISYAVLQTTRTDNIGRQSREEKNPDGLLQRTTDASGAQIVHQHDAFGQLVRTKDPLGNQVAMEYDVRGRKTVLNDPDAGVVVYCYDALGQLKAQQNSNQRNSHSPAPCPTISGAGTQAATVAGWTTLAYDALGRMTQRLHPDIGNSPSGYRSQWVYDNCANGKGRLCATTTSQGHSRSHAFDGLGRPIGSRTNWAGGTVAGSGVTYHPQTGRPSTQTYPSGLRVGFDFTARGYLRQVQLLTQVTVQPLPLVPGGTPAPSQVLGSGYALWEAQSINAWGKAQAQRYGNGITSSAQFNAHTGRLERLAAGADSGTANGVVDQQLGWNSVDQLVSRIDAVGGAAPLTGVAAVPVRDDYVYDTIGRLSGYQVSVGAAPNAAPNRNVQLHYNALGMLLYNSEVGNYSYPVQGLANGRPHAVQSIEGPVVGLINPAYGYDLSGNATSASSGRWRSIRYTSSNLPDSSDSNNPPGQGGIQGPGGSPAYSWQYDENQARIREMRVGAGATRVTWFLHPDQQGGLGFEREEIGTDASNRHYLSAGGTTVAVLVTSGSLAAVQADGVRPVDAAALGANKLEYWHPDHLGSLIATTDHAATLTARYSFDAFGKRRYLTGSYDAAGSLVYDWTGGATAATNAGTDRGYTGHEHLDDIGLIHMNGRLYDPRIARFLQADPFIQAPGNLQSFDRYAYCFNSPTTCTDPSGYFSLGKIARIVVGIVIAINAPYLLETYAGFATGTFVTAGLATFPGAAAAGFFAGAVSGGSVKSGLQGAFSAALFYGVGNLLGGGEFFANANPSTNGLAGVGGDKLAAVALHGVAGCVSSVAAGGKCGPGALSAAFSKTLAVNGFLSATNSVEAAIQAAVAGGVGSVLGGGTFANGAQTGAFSYLFNFLSHASYSLSSGELAVTDADTGATATGKFKSATERGIPVTEGEYDILQGANGNFRLERRDGVYGNDYDATTGQQNIRLHGPGNSFGCVTACSLSDWAPVKDVISNTVPKIITVNKYYDLGAFLKGYNPGIFRIKTGTEQVNWYGTLKVTK